MILSRHSPNRGRPHALVVLATYAVLGAGVALIAFRLRTHGAPATAAG